MADADPAPAPPCIRDPPRCNPVCVCVRVRVRVPQAFELAHTAIYDAIKRQPDTFEKDHPGMGEMQSHAPDETRSDPDPTLTRWP